MLMRLRVCVTSLVLMLAGVGISLPQALSRIEFKVFDEVGEPLSGVKLSATTRQTELAGGECMTGAGGRCTIGFVDATMIYDLVLVKEGYQELRVVFKPVIDNITVGRRFMLAAHGSGVVSGQLGRDEDPANLQRGNRGTLRYNQAYDAELAGELEAALDLAAQAVRLDPGLAPARVLLARVALRLGRFDEASKRAAAAIDIDPTAYEAHHIRYEACRQLGDDTCLKEAAAGLKEAGTLTEVASNAFNQAIDAFNQGNLTVAEDGFRQAVRLDPEMVPAYAALAGIYIQQQRWQQAIAMAEQVLRRDPSNLKHHKVRYMGLRALGDTAAADTVLQELAVGDPQWAAPELYNSASQLYNNDQVEAARAALDSLLVLLPEYPPAHYLLGLCYDREGDLERARIHLEQYLILDPNGAEADVARPLLISMSQKLDP
jgi:tetratricopeptide (TPR) repeat protein